MPPLDGDGRIVHTHARSKLWWQGLLTWLAGTEAILVPKIYELLVKNIPSTVDKSRFRILLPRLVSRPYFDHSKHSALFNELSSHYGSLNEDYKAGLDDLKLAIKAPEPSCFHDFSELSHEDCEAMIRRLEDIISMFSRSIGPDSSGQPSQPNVQADIQRRDVVDHVRLRLEALKPELRRRAWEHGGDEDEAAGDQTPETTQLPE
jgi:hypothetical protein